MSAGFGYVNSPGPSPSSGSGISSGLGNVIGGIGGSLIGAGVSALSQHSANKKNEALQREAWARDDTRYGRMVKDLKAAGLNPILATGANPGQSQPVRVDSVGKEAGGHVAGAVQNAVSAYAAQTQRKMAEADISYRDMMTKLIDTNQKLLENYGPVHEENAIYESRARIFESASRRANIDTQNIAARMAINHYDEVVVQPALAGTRLTDARVKQVQEQTLTQIYETTLKGWNVNLMPLMKQELEENIRKTIADANFSEVQAKDFMLSLEQKLASHHFGPRMSDSAMYQDIKRITFDTLETFGKATGAIGNLWRSSTNESTFRGYTESMQRPAPTPPRGRIGF